MLNLSRPLVFFDLETTGVNTSTDRIVQIAAIKTKLTQKTSQLMNVDSFETLINPGEYIPQAASDVHNIFDQDVEDAPTFEDIAEELETFMSKCDWAGYNIVGFDVPLLLNEFSRCGISIDVPNLVDSFKIFKEDLPHKLEAAHRHYVGKTFDGAHDAMNDVNATIRVFHAQSKLGIIPDNAKEINDHFRVPGQQDLAGKLVLKNGAVCLNFGKHKGTAILDVDQSYLKWCKKNNVLASDAWDVIKDCFRKRH